MGLRRHKAPSKLGNYRLQATGGTPVLLLYWGRLSYNDRTRLVELAGLVLEEEAVESVGLFPGEVGLTVRLVIGDGFSGHNSVILDMDFADAQTGPGIDQDERNNRQGEKGGEK